MRRTFLSLLLCSLALVSAWSTAFQPVAGMHYRLRDAATGRYLEMETPAAKIGNNDGDHLAGLTAAGSELVFDLKEGSQTEYAIGCVATGTYLVADRWSTSTVGAADYYWTFEQDGSALLVHQDKAANGNRANESGYLTANQQTLFVDGTQQNAVRFTVEAVVEAGSREELVVACATARAQIGTQPGQYPEAAVAAAEVVANNTNATSDEIAAAMTALRDAMVTLQAGHYYRFRNTSFQTYISVNDPETHLQARTDDTADPRQIWKLEDNNGSLYLRNLYTGTYPQQIVGGTANTSAVGPFDASKALTYNLHAAATMTADAQWNLLVAGNQINCERDGNLNLWNGDNAHFNAYEVNQTEAELQTMADNYAPRIEVKNQGPAKNYCLHLTADATVNCGKMTELDGRTTFSIQFFLAARQWTPGATILSRGDGLAVKVTGEGELTLTAGSTQAVVATGLKRHIWNHVTLIVSEGQLSAVINGTLQEGIATLEPLPASTDCLILGEGFTGRIDELRIWRTAVDPTFGYFVNATLNPFQPAWNDLVAYYKFDMTECPNIVDYKGIHTAGAALHHGLMSEGAERQLVTDNAQLPYLYCGAYSNNERFFDRAIPRQQYLMANDLIFLGIQSYGSGHAYLKSPNSHATFSGGTQWKRYQSGHYGVMHFDGTGLMTAPFTALMPVGQGMTVETWLYLDEWTEGAVLFDKGNFRIALGPSSGKQIYITCNGKTWTASTPIFTKKWVHLGVSTVLGDTEGFVLALGGQEIKAKAPTDAPGIGLGFEEGTDVHIGEGLKGYIDDFTTWNRSFTAGEMNGHTALMRMEPGKGNYSFAPLFRAGAGYTFADEDNAGYDSYSQDEWTRVMASAYAGHKNWQMRLAVETHNGWSSTLNNATKRETMAQDIAALCTDEYAGVEFDLEWAYADWEKNVLGLLAKRVKELLPEGKTLHVSVHGRDIGIPQQQYWPYIDGFTVQQYGPQADNYWYSKFVSQYNNLHNNRGIPAEKLYLSWATITSNGSAGGAVQGLAWNFYPANELVLEKGDTETKVVNGNTYTFAGPWQTYERALFATQHQAQGIFYWDMGNDLVPSNPNNLARHCNYGLSANVDTLVLAVQLDPSVTGEEDAIQRLASSGDNALNVQLAGRQLTLALSGATLAQATLLTPGGQTLMRTQRREPVFNLQSLPAGAYIVEARDTIGRRYARKLVVK